MRCFVTAVLLAFAAFGLTTQAASAHPCLMTNEGRVICMDGAPTTIEAVKRSGGRHARTAHLMSKTSMVELTTAQGCHVWVHPAYYSKFETFFRLLKEHDYRVPCGMVACWSPGHAPGSNHHIGAACDIQTGRNRGPRFVYHMHSIIQQAGLYDGCSFRDCGHVEALRGLYNHVPGNIARAIPAPGM